jgi:predicted RNA-binding protein YlxR (DUF448 family)
MPFLSAAQSHVQTLQPGSADRLILEFLLQNAVGRHNAQPWSAVDTHLNNHGVSIRQQTFQQGLLKKSREGEVFIGSNDHGIGRGYFIIQEREDAEIIRQWYLRRIQVEQGHLDQLEVLIQQQWP